MGRKTSVIPLGFLMLICLGGCFYDDTEFTDAQDVTGYVPVYGSTSATEIRMTPSRTIENPGKIYLYGNYLLINEQQKGIHVFDNSNPATPVNIGFLQLLGNSDMAIKDGLLYADHLGNIVALTVNDFGIIEEKGRLPLRTWLLGVPPPSGYYFECVHPEKGIVVNWKEAELKNPSCYAL